MEREESSSLHVRVVSCRVFTKVCDEVDREDDEVRDEVVALVLEDSVGDTGRIDNEAALSVSVMVEASAVSGFACMVDLTSTEKGLYVASIWPGGSATTVAAQLATAKSEETRIFKVEVFEGL